MVRLSLLLAAMLMLSSCAHERTIGAAASPAVIVKMSDFKYEPKVIEIQAGDTVEWDNTSVLSWHTVTCDPAKAKKKEDVQLPAAAQAFNSGRLDPGNKYRYTFWTPGTYRYFCIPHEKLGMVGEVVVRPR